MNYESISTATEEEFLSKATTLLEERIAAALAKTGRCILGLCGGSTPKMIYHALAERPIEWTNVWVFLTDERYVDAQDPESNFGMIKRNLVDIAHLAPEQIIAPNTSLPLDGCVAAYDESLRQLFSTKGEPDVSVLGMGTDGHVASLFPPLPEDAFGGALVLRTFTESFAVRDRITVTMPVLLRAEHHFVFLKGEEKKQMWETVTTSQRNPLLYPLQEILAAENTTVVTQW